MRNIKIGWAEEKFVFPKPVSLIGQFAERISEYEEKPLTATALAIDNGVEQLIICSADLVKVSIFLVERVRDIVKEKNQEIDCDKIVINAIHTHTGPGYTGHSVNARQGGGTGYFRLLLESELPSDKKYVEREKVSANHDIMNDDELLEELSFKIANAILKAWEKKEDGSFTNAFGRAPVGMCRRASYSDGSAQMWGDTNRAVFEALEGGSDSGIELLYVFDKDEKLTGVVANLACPAQCVQHRKFISPDFWGEAKMLLRKHFGEGLFLLPLCSAAGDQCPVDLVRWVEPESDVNDPNIARSQPLKRKADPSMFDLSGMRKIGKRIANEIIGVYEEGLDKAQSDVVFEHRVVQMHLPLRRATLAQAKEARRVIKEYLHDKEGDVDYTDVAKLQVYLGVLQRLELQDTLDAVKVETHMIRLGSIAIVTNPFELFLDYGNQMKARSLAEQTFIVQLACGAEGYLPTKKAEDGGHYSAFIASGGVGHEGGEMLVRNTLQEIRELFS